MTCDKDSDTAEINASKMPIILIFTLTRIIKDIHVPYNEINNTTIQQEICFFCDNSLII